MASSVFTFWTLTQIFWCLHVAAQTTTSLPPPHDYSDGRFTSPNNSIAQVFTAGSTMIVSWETSFRAVNIYLIFDEDFDSPWSLTSEYDLSFLLRLI